jgi:hypothetical protein
LPLPNGLIGQAKPAQFDIASARPFFPFLSTAQILILLVTYVFVAGAIMLIFPKAWLFIAAGSAIGVLPSIIQAAPARVTVRSPRPEPWADFTRQWVALNRYRQDGNNPDAWLPDMPIWMKWPGDSIRLRVTTDTLEVRGRRLLMRQLKRNYDRITERGHRWD